MNNKLKQFNISLWIVFIFLPVYASAHHFKGLPHFSYFENYPQVPQEEFLGRAGEYEFSLVIYDFQGIKREDAEQPDDVRLYLVAYNLRQNSVYNGPIILEILDRDEIVYTQNFAAAAEESIYTLQQTFSPSGKYALRVTFDTDDRTQALIPFKLSVQNIDWGKWIALSLVGLISIVAVGSRRARIKMDRKMNAESKRSQEKIVSSNH